MMHFGVMLARLLCVFLLATGFGSFSSSAQTGTIRGLLIDASTGEPLAFATAYLDSTQYGAHTNVDGYFHISKLPAGEYTLVLTSFGCLPLRVPIAVTANAIVQDKWALEPIAAPAPVILPDPIECHAVVNMRKMQPIAPKPLPPHPDYADPEPHQYLQVPGSPWRAMAPWGPGRINVDPKALKLGWW